VGVTEAASGSSHENRVLKRSVMSHYKHSCLSHKKGKIPMANFDFEILSWCWGLGESNKELQQVMNK